MNVVVWGQVKSENSSLPVAVEVSKTRALHAYDTLFLVTLLSRLNVHHRGWYEICRFCVMFNRRVFKDSFVQIKLKSRQAHWHNIDTADQCSCVSWNGNLLASSLPTNNTIPPLNHPTSPPPPPMWQQHPFNLGGGISAHVLKAVCFVRHSVFYFAKKNRSIASHNGHYIRKFRVHWLGYKKKQIKQCR